MCSLATSASRASAASQVRSLAGAHLALALDPASVRVDGRDHRDRLAFVANYAKLILYYDKSNQLAGNWQSFFLKEPAILLAAISKTDYSVYHLEFMQLERGLAQRGNSKIQTPIQTQMQIVYGNQLCGLLQNMLVALNQWLYFMERGVSSYSLRSFLKKKISESLAGQLALLCARQSVLSGLTQGQVTPPYTLLYQTFEPLWFNQGQAGLYMPTADPSAQSNAAATGSTSNEAKIAQILHQLRSIYFAVFDVFVQVVENAQTAFQQLQDQPSLFPDTALLMVFSRLMQTQQEQLNQYAQKHLDFYYQAVLQQQLQTAQADQVVVCLSLPSKVSSYTLPANTAFKAGIYPDSSDILFCNAAAVEINQAAIDQVNTLNYGNSGSGNGLYLSTIANANQVTRNSMQEVVSWPAFGANTGLAIQQGFAFASPMLYLTQGQRTITIKLSVSGGAILPAEYFADAQVFLSSANGWLALSLAATVSTPDVSTAILSATATPTSTVAPSTTSPPRTSVAPSETPTTAAPNAAPVFVTSGNLAQAQSAVQAQAPFSLQIQLQPSDPAIIAFAAGAGPDGIASSWPMLKIVLGCSADLANPPQICVANIAVDVQQFDQFTLANDLSTLPNTGAQWMLGPLPDVGSHFYVGSNECFAKPLTALKLVLNWDNLPADFSQYYASYNQYLATLPLTTPPLLLPQFTNTAFVGNWAVLNQTNWNSVLLNANLATQIPLFQQYAPSPAPTATPTAAPTATAKATLAPVPSTSHPTGDLQQLAASEKAEPASTPEPSLSATPQASVAASATYAVSSLQTITTSATPANNNPTLSPSPTPSSSNQQTSIFSFNMPTTYVAIPSLALATLPTLDKAQNGYLSFELALPFYAFGQSLYAPLVSYISLCNAQVLIAQAKATPAPSPTPAPTPAPTLSEAQKLAEDGVKVLEMVDPGTAVAAPLLNEVISAGPGLLQGVKNGLSSVVSSVKNGVSSAISNVGQGIRSIFSGIKNLFSGNKSAPAASSLPAASTPPALPNSAVTSSVTTTTAAPTTTAPTTTAPATTPPATTPEPTATAAPTPPTGLQVLPNLPYSPKLSSMQGSSYAALAQCVLSNAPTAANVYPFEYYHYGPFVPYLAFDATAPTDALGFANLLPMQGSNSLLANVGGALPLVPGVSGEGCLYVGFSGVSAPCTISLYAEISSDGQQALLDADSVGYFYWSNSLCDSGGVANAGNVGWQPLTILQNGTNHLNCSGIIQFYIPQLTPQLSASQLQLPASQQIQIEQVQLAQSYSTAPIMPNSDFWLAIATCSSGVKIKLSYLNTQAVSLVRTTMASLPTGETPSIAANIIAATQNKITQIATVIQPFPSYGGVAAENDSSYGARNSFYRRVSERLNHKDRAASRSDYVTMAYSASQELFYAKTTQNSTQASSNNAAANLGVIRLGVVKAYSDATHPNAFRPALSSCEREAILQYLQSRVSAMVSLQVSNLQHEEVTITANLAIAATTNQATLRSQINQQLKIFLSPWIASSGPQTSISQGIHQAELINFLQNQADVLGVSSLSIAVAGVSAQKFPVCAQSEEAILVSAMTHVINFNINGVTVTPVTVSTVPKSIAVPFAPHAPASSPAPSAAPASPAATSTPSATPSAAAQMPGHMVMSPNGISLLTQWEGSSATMYGDATGNPTIGVGHCLTSTENASGIIDIGGVAVPWKNGLNSAQIQTLLSQDLTPTERCVNQGVKVPLNQNQFDALTSFTFNVGTGAFTSSTLLKVLNQGQYDQVPPQLSRWCKDSNGNVVPGLQNRRNNEIALWNTPV